MNQLDNQKILDSVLNHLEDINSIISDSNFLEKDKLLGYIENRNFDLNATDPNLYLASLLQKKLFNISDEVKISSDESEKILLISFLTTVLDELELKNIDYIVK